MKKPPAIRDVPHHSHGGLTPPFWGRLVAWVRQWEASFRGDLWGAAISSLSSLENA
jgi:hypothetical protein